MKVTIVCAYNQCVDMTMKFLDVMDATTKNFRECYNDIEMILVNGGCSTKIEHPFITTRIDLDVNNGFGPTVNAGLRKVPVDSDYIFYVGNDSFPTTNTWLEELIVLQGKTGAGIVCPANDRPGMEAYNHLYTSSTDDYWTVEFFPSIAYLITKECFDKIGLWDERFIRTGMYGDNDYCRRVRNAGFSIIVSKHILLNHLLSQESSKCGTIGEDMNINNQLFIDKWK